MARAFGAESLGADGFAVRGPVSAAPAVGCALIETGGNQLGWTASPVALAANYVAKSGDTMSGNFTGAALIAASKLQATYNNVNDPWIEASSPQGIVVRGGNGTGLIRGTLGANRLDCDATGWVAWQGRSYITSPSDGQLQLQSNNNSVNESLLLGQSGAATGAIIKRGLSPASRISLIARNGSDSANADMYALNYYSDGVVVLGSNSRVQWGNRSYITSPADGTLQCNANAGGYSKVDMDQLWVRGSQAFHQSGNTLFVAGGFPAPTFDVKLGAGGMGAVSMGELRLGNNWQNNTYIYQNASLAAGESATFYQTAGVNRWQMGCMGTGFWGLYNYYTASWGLQLGYANNGLSIAGPLTIGGALSMPAGANLSLGTITSVQSSGNNLQVLDGVIETGFIFKNTGVSRWELFDSANVFRLYNYGASRYAWSVDGASNNLYHNGPFNFQPGASYTPTNNGEAGFELTSNTSLKIKVKGLDGVVRSNTLTLT